MLAISCGIKFNHQYFKDICMQQSMRKKLVIFKTMMKNLSKKNYSKK